MPIIRKFLLPSAFARLISVGEPAPIRIVEDYFAQRTAREHFVRYERDRCYLVTRTHTAEGEPQERRDEIPASQAEALSDLAGGTVAYDRLGLHLGPGVYAALDRFVVPGDLAIVSVASESRLFTPLQWFGREVTGNPAFTLAGFALHGLPALEEGPLSHSDLEALLDWREGRSHVTTEAASGNAQEEMRDRAFLANLATAAKELSSGLAAQRSPQEHRASEWLGSEVRTALRA